MFDCLNECKTVEVVDDEEEGKRMEGRECRRK
jgi:hypothetical protein